MAVLPIRFIGDPVLRQACRQVDLEELATAEMQGFIDDIRAEAKDIDDSFCVIFGHLGDGNLHVILGNRTPEKFDYDGIQELLYGAVERYDGSVSAEHGIGLAKRDQLGRSRNETELQLMMGLKKMLDPQN